MDDDVTMAVKEVYRLQLFLALSQALHDFYILHLAEKYACRNGANDENAASKLFNRSMLAVKRAYKANNVLTSMGFDERVQLKFAIEHIKRCDNSIREDAILAFDVSYYDLLCTCKRELKIDDLASYAFLNKVENIVQEAT